MIPEFPFHDRYGYPVPSLSNESTAPVYLNPGLRSVIIPPSQQERLGDTIGCLEFPVNFAGQFHRTSAGTAFRIIQQDMERTLRHILGDKLDVAAGGHRLANLDDACLRLLDQYSTVIRLSTRAFVSWLSNDPEYVDWYATTYADNVQSLNSDDIRNTFDSFGSPSIRTPPDTDLNSTLDDVVDRYNIDILQTVVNVALDPDLQTSVGQDDARDPVTIVIRELDTVNLLQRCETAVNALLDFNSDPLESSLPRLRQRLRDAVGDSKLTDPKNRAKRSSRSGLERTPVDDLPIAKALAGAVTANSCSDGLLDLVGYPTGQAWLFTRAFEAGGFGAAVYQRANGGSNWLVNPFITTDNIDQSYAALWERAFVADRFTSQVFNPGERRINEASIRCPLCALSSGYCRPDGCAFRDLRAGIEHLLADLVAAIEDIK